MIKIKKIYAEPEATCVGLHTEGVLCGSEWYLKGGEGNFSYDVEEDDTWA